MAAMAIPPLFRAADIGDRSTSGGRHLAALLAQAHARQTRHGPPDASAHPRQERRRCWRYRPAWRRWHEHVCRSAEALEFTAIFHGWRPFVPHHHQAVFRGGAAALAGSLCAWDPRPSPEGSGLTDPGQLLVRAGTEWSQSTGKEAGRLTVLRDHVNSLAQALASYHGAKAVAGRGCGGGLFLGMMRERGLRVVGLDYSRGGSADRVAARSGTRWRPGMRPLSRRRFRGRHYVPVMEHLFIHGHTGGGTRVAAGRTPGAAGTQCRSWQAGGQGRAWNGDDIRATWTNFRASDLEEMIASAGFEVLRRKISLARDTRRASASSLGCIAGPYGAARAADANRAAQTGKDLAYFALVAASAPLRQREAACGAGPQ